jgi:pimeloyl-ACP methyl ester carboxylesterase
VELHAVRHGADLPVDFVLVHGLASAASMWAGVGEALAARGHGSIAVDLRGHGLSPKPDDGYDFDTVVADLVPFLVDRPVLVGQSYGGNVAVAAAARHPELVRSIVCIDGGAIDLTARFDSLEDALVAMRPPYERFEGTRREDHERLLRQSHHDWPESGIQGALAVIEVLDDGTIRSRLPWPRHRQIVEAMWHEPPTKHFPTIEVPVLFVMASSRMRDGVDAALAALPHGRAVWFEGAHHDVHAQKPLEVAELLAGMR